MSAVVVLIVLVAIFVLIALFFALQYNGLVGMRNKIEAAYAQIDVQLTRRHKLIPNLVETVKGYATHEKETLDAVIRARNMAMSATTVGEKAEAENVISGALKSIFALSEAYPDLKANANFAQLQAELASTEDRIAFARQYYNDVVRTYNTKIEVVPTVVIAKAFGFEAREYFQADTEARGGVDVDFSS